MFSVPCMGMNFGKCCGSFPDCPPLDDISEASDIENLSTGKTEVFLTNVVEPLLFSSQHF